MLNAQGTGAVRWPSGKLDRIRARNCVFDVTVCPSYRINSSTNTTHIAYKTAFYIYHRSTELEMELKNIQY